MKESEEDKKMGIHVSMLAKNDNELKVVKSVGSAKEVRASTQQIVQDNKWFITRQHTLLGSCVSNYP